jgi:hypothetical protein
MLTLESIQARVRRLEDIRHIERLQRIYGYYRDAGEWEQVVELFSNRAESVEVADHGVYKGKEGIRRFYIDLIKGGKERKPRRGMMSIALQLQGVVTVAEDGLTANGRWYGFLIEARPTAALHDGPLRQTWGHGIYENAFVREGDQWLFSKLHFFLNFRTPFEDGWLKTPVIGQHGPDADVPPDEPPTAYHPYPSEYIFKPHFSHPITGERP